MATLLVRYLRARALLVTIVVVAVVVTAGFDVLTGWLGVETELELAAGVVLAVGAVFATFVALAFVRETRG